MNHKGPTNVTLYTDGNVQQRNIRMLGIWTQFKQPYWNAYPRFQMLSAPNHKIIHASNIKNYLIRTINFYGFMNIVHMSYTFLSPYRKTNSISLVNSL